MRVPAASKLMALMESRCLGMDGVDLVVEMWGNYVLPKDKVADMFATLQS